MSINVLLYGKKIKQNLDIMYKNNSKKINLIGKKQMNFAILLKTG